MRMGFLEADPRTASEDPIQQHFGNVLKTVVDSVLAEKFGNEMDVSRMSKLAAWDEAGWFEKIEKWTEEGYVSNDEINELLEVSNDPKLLATLKENKALKDQLSEKDTKAKDTATEKQAEVESSFDKLAGDSIDATLTDIWRTSTLRDIASDTPEIKEEKAFLRSHLTEEAKAAFRTATDRSKLVDGFRSGQQNTAVYKTNLANAINSSVLATRKNTAIAERLFAKVYGKSPNSRLTPKTPEADNQQPSVLQPTTTQTFGGEKMTREQIKTSLAESIASMG